MSGAPGDAATLIFVGGLFLSGATGIVTTYALLKLTSCTAWWATLGGLVVAIWPSVIIGVFTIKPPLWITIFGLTVLPLLVASWTRGLDKLQELMESRSRKK